ncbi:MAG: 2-isopropylmalate synthase [Gemmatimonadetes bacterium]|jgi:citrate (Re)-synthase|nr:2-isopropylmalate synthase [Gemmatimonadota bacterium]MBT6149499.1 2-isopropylmalate synthase [Gemmatimonadota bacterium]MBT7863592.1 2-isopropylmalate synthase [Gemmatimonadota bacterium]
MAPTPKPLVEVDEPNTLDDMFDYSRPPRIVYESPIYEEINGEVVKFDPQEALKRDLVITDTTFRDGQQARPPYTVEQQVKLYDMLAKLGGPNGVIRQTEFFLYTANDRKALDECRALGHKYPEVTSWIRADKGDFRLVKEAGVKETGVLTPSSDYHIFYKLKKDRKKAFDDYIEIVEAAWEAGIRPRVHLEDVTRADIDGFVKPYVSELIRRSEQVSPDLHVKIRLCDTMGFGVPTPGAALPRSIPKLVHAMTQELGLPHECLEWHGHNDFHKTHINGVTAWLYGCNALNSTLFGFGERTGNPPLEGALIEYISLHGDLCGIDTMMIQEIADYMRSIGVDIAPNYPFVGKDFNTTRAGIHAGGLRSDERIYNIFDTTTLFGRPPRVSITDKSGVDGIALWVNTFLGLEGDQKLSKIKVHKVARWVMDQYEVHSRMSAITDDELAEQVKQHLPEQYANRKDS